MKSFGVIMLIVGFVAVAVFGFAAMDAGGAHSHSGCLVATLNGGLCPVDDSIDSLAFHMNAAKSFSTAILGGNIMYLLFFAAAFLAFLVASTPPLIGSRFLIRFRDWRRRFTEFFAYSITRQLLFWLSRYEQSPAFSSRVAAA